MRPRTNEPELDALLFLLRSQWSQTALDQAAGIIQGPGFNEKRFVFWCQRHKLTPQVYQLIQDLGPEAPGALMALEDQLAPLVQANTLRVMRNIGAGIQLSRLLNQAGIGHLFLKGTALSQLLYGRLDARHCGDIDLYPDPARLTDALRLMVENGYRHAGPLAQAQAASPRAFAFLKHAFTLKAPENGPPFDLHSRLFVVSSLYPRSFQAIHGRAQTLELSGITIKTMGEEDLFLYLAVHGAVHFWRRLVWLFDWTRLAQALPPAQLAGYSQVAAALGLGRALSQAMELGRAVLGAPLGAAGAGARPSSSYLSLVNRLIKMANSDGMNTLEKAAMLYHSLGFRRDAAYIPELLARRVLLFGAERLGRGSGLVRRKKTARL